VIRDVAFPPNLKFAGEGLSQDTPPEVMQQFFEQAIKEHSPWTVDLGGLETDHVRLECDREHLTWSNARECNGGPYNVPFGVFHNAVVYGEPLAPRPAVAPYEPVLRHGVIRPVAPTGMTVDRKADSVQFRSPRLSVGFSLNRPMLGHLGWDDLGKGRADINRLLSTRTWATWVGCNRKVDLVGGLTGPVLRTLDYDIASHLWTGRVDVEGNEVRYSDLMAIEDVRLDVVFRVMEDRIQVTVDQTCRRPVVAIEYEAWRFAWDAKTSPTGVSGAPTQKPGRNGHVELPVYLTGEGSGCLSFSAAGTAGISAPESYLQVESYREAEALTCGVVPAERAPDGFGVVLPEGKRHHEFELVVTNLQPRRVSSADETHLTEGIRQHWATVFSCYRPEYRGFSNNCISVNCHQGQWSQTEVLLHTDQPASGPDLAAMHRFTVEKALLDGGGYGYWREYYMDSDPSLLCAAGTAYRMDASVEWLQRIRMGLVEVFERMVSTSGNDGLLVNLHRSGNTGEFTLSTNGIDVVRFGHLDAFSNAWAYRAGVRVGAAPQRLGGNCQVAVPELVERGGKFADDRPRGHDIVVRELRLGVDLEILIADVAAADERQRAVGHQQFIVHSIVEPRRVDEEVQPSYQPRVPAVRRRIENSHLDGRIHEQSQKLLVAGDPIPVIDQHTYAHPAVRGTLQAVGQHAARLVAAKYEVLKIERALGGIDHLHSELEAVDAGIDDAKCRIAAVLARRVRKLLTEAGALRMGERRGHGLGIIRTRWKPCATA